MDSASALNQSRGVVCGRLPLQPAFDENLVEKILSRENLYEAFRRVKSNNGSPGLDGISVQDFREWVEPLWSGIFQSLRDGTYKPSPVLRCEIPKDNGSMRLLGIPTVLDRTIQQAVSQIRPSTNIFQIQVMASVLFEIAIRPSVKFGIISPTATA